MRLNLKHFAIIATLAFTSLTSWAQVDPSNTDPLLVEAKLLPYEWSPGQGGDLELKFKLPAGYHAYEDQFDIVILEPAGFKIAPYKIEPIKEWYDKFSKKNRRGVELESTLTAHMEAPPRFLKKHQFLKLELTYQACSDQFCLFPTKKEIQIPIAVTVVEGAPTIQAAETVITDSAMPTSFFDTANFNKYLGSGMLAGLFFVFLAGIFTSFTPCIFPMIPITLAILGNNSEKRSRLQNFISSCIYVLGIATTYSILGLVAASSGGLFGASLGNPIVLAVVCAIFLTMALSMYGLFDIQVPAYIRNRFGKGGSSTSIGGIYLTGLFAGIVASPCVGPVLVAILTYVASTQNKLLGFLYLFTYAIGLGLIFIALGLFSQLSKVLPRSGAWMNGSKFVLGSLMMTAFYYYLDLLLPDRWFDAALGLGLVVIASVYGAFISAKGHSALNHIRKGVMQAVLFVGFGYIILAAFDLRPMIRGHMMGTSSINAIQKLNWQPYSDELLAQATKDEKPVIIDFWAEWCAACHELEQHTLTDPRVRLLSEKFVLLKFDATKDSEQLRALKQKYKIQGLPTVIFINPHGIWNDALTLTEFEKADKFLTRMNGVLH